MNTTTHLQFDPRVRQDALISHTYIQMRDALYGYVFKRIGSRVESEDIVQNIFANLLEQTTLLSERTIVGFVYAIARNQVIDYLRRHARSEKAAEYFSRNSRSCSHATEEQIAVNELERMEKRSVESMSPRKAKVYVMYVHEGRSVSQISDALRLSRRTVENHIFSARLELRSALRYAL